MLPALSEKQEIKIDLEPVTLQGNGALKLLGKESHVVRRKVRQSNVPCKAIAIGVQSCDSVCWPCRETGSTRKTQHKGEIFEDKRMQMLEQS